MNSGKLLEAFVRQVEELLLPYGFAITLNERVFDDDGVQIAEFDIVIEGRVGSTTLKWLIECRDRPSEGAAGGEWIEQLVGRRNRFGFSKVIAVSTTGFTAGAKKYAAISGIELREVADSNVESIADWFRTESFMLVKNSGNLSNVTLNVSKDEPQEIRDALLSRLGQVEKGELILRSTETGALVTFAQAFTAAMRSVGDLHKGLEVNGAARPVKLRVQYPDDNSHYVVETPAGEVRITEILFEGEIFSKGELIPLAVVRRYANLSANEEIASTAGFRFDVDGATMEIEFQRLAQSGETCLVMRRME